jgi:hypothetical protein
MAGKARGIRNNNPGNIDRTATKWQGMAADQSSDPRFIVFVSPQYGIRAMAKTLFTYQNTHGLRTVRKIINRWAPPVENDTGAYVEHVAALLGVKPDETIDLDNSDIMLPLVKAIIRHENHSQPYSDAVILEGLRMAGVHDAKPKPLMKRATFMTKAAGAVAVGMAGTGEVAGTYVAPVKSWTDALTPFIGAPFVQKMVFFGLGLAGVLLTWSMVASYLKKKALGE